jgi:glycosyltransferase involved in cell wall biosynthesis
MLSIVIPAYNEEENVKIIYSQLKKVLDNLKDKYEIIFVDDGSKDKTFQNLKFIANNDSKVKVIRFNRNFGQSSALSAGFRQSKGNIIITLDADLQNDPQDIPKLIEKLKEGFDVVCGWRKERKDDIKKKFPSIISNWIASKVMNLKIHDFGCTLRAYKKEVVEDMEIYGEIHRYLPALALFEGYSVTELKVKHNPRRYGKSKYKTFRIFKGLSDIISLTFLKWIGPKPTYLINSLGIITLGVGIFSLIYLLISSLIYRTFNFTSRISFFITFLTILIGIQFIIFGILSEMITKIMYDIKGKRFYKIKEILNE